MSGANLGFGACGFGAAGAGFGSPATTNSSTATLLRQADGTPGEVAKIDTRTGDYELDATGQKVGWDALSQKVYLALRTVRGSAAVTTLGIDLPDGVITDNVATRVRLAVEQALARLIADNLIELVDVLVSRTGSSGVRVEVRWRRVATGRVEFTVL